MNNNRNNLAQNGDQIVDRAARELRQTRVPQGPPPEVLEAVLAAGSLPPNEKQRSFHRKGFKMNRLAKIAAAILIIAGIGAGIAFLTHTNGTATIAWADVGAVVEQARTICFTMTVDKGQAIRYRARTMYMVPGFLRMELQDSVAIFDWAKGRFMTLDLKAKTAISALITEIDNPWKDNWYEELRTLVGSPNADDLGEKKINGRITKGWRVVSPTETATVWADATTAELVQVVFEAEQERIVMDDFEFDKKLDESIFSFKVPDDYVSYTMPTMKESDPALEDVAGLLRIWAKGSANRFPPTLNSWNFPQAAQKVDWRTEEADEATLRSMIGKAFWFLNARPGWKYIGAGVELGDASKPIFWHKPQDSQTYKVIYGDLSIKDVPPEDLPK